MLFYIVHFKKARPLFIFKKGIATEGVYVDVYTLVVVEFLCSVESSEDNSEESSVSPFDESTEFEFEFL